MDKKKRHTALLCLIAVLFAFGPMAHAQDIYKGKRTEIYNQRAFSFLQTFYGLVADMCTENEVLDTYLLSVSDHYVAPQAVFIPDYISLTDKSNVVSLSNYVLTLKSAYNYGTQQRTGDMPVFSISDPKFLDIHYTVDRQGVTVNLSYAIELSYGGQCVYRGHSQSVVVFPDLVDIASCRVRQISRIDGSEVLAPANAESNEDASVPGRTVTQEVLHDERFGAILGGRYKWVDMPVTQADSGIGNADYSSAPVSVTGEYYRLVLNDHTTLYFQYPAEGQTTAIPCVCEQYQAKDQLLSLSFSKLVRDSNGWELAEPVSALLYRSTHTAKGQSLRFTPGTNPELWFGDSPFDSNGQFHYSLKGFPKPVSQLRISPTTEFPSYTAKYEWKGRINVNAYTF